MNKVILMGRLTRDPEVRYTQNANGQMAIARYSIAVDRSRKREGEPDADFFNCTSFGRQGEFVEKYLKKGTKVVVVGRIQNDNYTNKEGQQVYSVQILVDEVEFAESKSSQSNYGGGQPAAGNGAGAPAPAGGDDFINVPSGVIEDLPFN
ncbi:MAG: single-stranded DNA-binding protein [Lachnospiraceae bacterium]|nr:single-stranded DNA-binding protein [Lachnospiraceae bacterium]